VTTVIAELGSPLAKSLAVRRINVLKNQHFTMAKPKQYSWQDLVFAAMVVIAVVGLLYIEFGK
jgi:hypothetical protein